MSSMPRDIHTHMHTDIMPRHSASTMPEGDGSIASVPLFASDAIEHEIELRAAQRELERLRSALARVQVREGRLARWAVEDCLTELPNRRFFMQRLEELVSAARTQPRQFAVMYLDLDRFKPINDSHGHAIGDFALRVVAARLKACMRTEDTVSRLGGDEFGCVLTNSLTPDELRRLALKMIDTVCAPMQLAHHVVVVGASVGIALWPEDGASADVLLRSADAAMYRAKRAASGFAFVPQADQITSARKSHIELVRNC
jgi:diguanylate cyclase